MSLFNNKEPKIPPHPERKPLFPQPPTAENIAAALGGSEDVVRRKLRLALGKEGELFFIEGLVDAQQLSQNVVTPLMHTDGGAPLRCRDLAARVMDTVSGNLTARRCESLEKALEDILQGWTVLTIAGEDCAVSFEAKGGETRSVTEPTVESVVKGSKDSFVETIRVNTSLVRRKIRNRALRLESALVGRQSRTAVSVVYMDSITDKKLVQEVKKRLEDMDTDALLSPAAVEEHMVRASVSTAFPLTYYTDLVDVFSENILAGRVGLLVDGLPLGYLMPATAPGFMRAPEDNGNNHIVASLIRVLRYLALFVTLLLPGFYVAVATFHQEMIPYKLARAIVVSKQSVPFTTTTEVIGMLIAFEILQEAGLRLPKSIGQTVSIVGALIVGQSAVEAKIFSPAVVIVVAVAGVAGYTIPNQDFSSAIRIWRFVVALGGAVLGMLGVATSAMMLIYHLCSIETFGVPYTAPLSGEGSRRSGGGIFTRPPYTKAKYRPTELNTKNVRREGE